MKIIDIGCGRNKLKGAIGIDFSSFSDADVVLNLNSDPLPFEDNSIDFVYSSHCLEHLSLDGFLHMISEIYRVCKDTAQIFIKVPYFNGSVNWANPFHNNKVCFNEHTFRFFSSSTETHCLAPNEYVTPTCQTWGLRYSANHEISIELESTNIEMIYFPEYTNKTDEEKAAYRKEFNNVVEAIHYNLRPIKPCPQLLENNPAPAPVDYSGKIADLQKWHEKQLDYLKTVNHIVSLIRDSNIPSLHKHQGIITAGLKALDYLNQFAVLPEGDLFITKTTSILFPPDEVYRTHYEKINRVQRLIEIIPTIDLILFKPQKRSSPLDHFKKYFTPHS